ncbi:MAG: SEFIR domain-containing protein [Phycisphaerales bacterium]|jgi:hypothetical protein
MADSPRVFISYSHDSEKHKERVREFSDWLRSRGVDAILDRYREHEAKEWNLWAEQEVDSAKFVLVVCTSIYYQRYLQQESAGRGEGVTYESIVIRNGIGRGGRGKFLAVYFDRADRQHVPKALSTEYSIATEADRIRLLHVLFNVPTVEQPPVRAWHGLTTLPAHDPASASHQGSGGDAADEAASTRDSANRIARTNELVTRWNTSFGASAVLRVLKRLTPAANPDDDAMARAKLLLAGDAWEVAISVQRGLIADQQALRATPAPNAARVEVIKEDARIARQILFDGLPWLDGPSHRLPNGASAAITRTGGLAELPAAAKRDRSAMLRYSPTARRMYAPAQVSSFLPETGFDAESADTMRDLIRHLDAVCGTSLTTSAAAGGSRTEAGQISLVDLRGMLGNRHEARNPDRPPLYIVVEGDPQMAGAIAVSAAVAERIKREIPELDRITIQQGTVDEAMYESRLKAAVTEVVRISEEICS